MGGGRQRQFARTTATTLTRPTGAAQAQAFQIGIPCYASIPEGGAKKTPALTDRRRVLVYGRTKDFIPGWPRVPP
jgi:hypothetical protein